MKKQVKLFLVLGIIILVSIVCTCLIISKNNAQKVQLKTVANFEENGSNEKMISGVQEDLINISECSDEFMENYFEESKKLDETNNKENILIVTSKEEIKDSFGASNIITAPNNQYILQYDSQEEKVKAFDELNKLNNTISVEENVVRTITGYNSWGIEKTKLDYAIEIANKKNLEEVTVAIIDTGCDMELFNQNFSGKIIETYNLLNPESEMVDNHGHGTHIAGTIAEGTPDNVNILPIRASANGNFTTVDIIAAINYVVYYDKADVINMSYGGYGYSESEYQALEAARQKNIICIAAAGNDKTSAKFYPASYNNTISISSVNSNLEFSSSFSNYGNSITFSAPGSMIYSINGTMSGTSMATPHAVSAVAILKGYNKDITLENTIDLLKIHALDLGNEGWDKYYGYGMISFTGAEFCDGAGCTKGDCDEFGIFKIKNENDNNVEIERIEIPMPVLTSYNYGTIYNLLATEMNIYKADETYETKALWELDDLVINGYNPFSSEEQTITVKWTDFSTTFTLTQSVAYLSNLGWEYTVLDENSIELTLYKDNCKNIGKLYIPETLDGYNVVALAENQNNMSKVFGNSIDAYSFEEITLPKTLTKLGRAAFFGSGVTKIISLADSIEVGDYAFFESGIELFDGTISELGESSFSGCTLLDNIKLSNSMEIIPVGAFCLCQNLKNINIPNSITSIEKNAFLYTRIKKLVLPNTVTTIGDYAFNSCVDLESVTLSESLIEIGECAFSYINIREIFIPKKVASIGKRAFSNCSSLAIIEVDKENLVYDSRDYCNAIIETETNTLLVGCYGTVIPSTVTIVGSEAFCGNLSLGKIYIPEGVIEIQDKAFYGCDYLREVYIPKSVTIIGKDVFTQSIFIWLYTDSYAKTYAVQNKIPYEALNISHILVNLKKDEYKAFDFVDNNDISIKLYYDRATLTTNDTYTEYIGIRGREEIIDTEYAYSTNIIPPGYIIGYGPKDDYGHYRTTFRYGDTYFTIMGIDSRGGEFEKQVEVTVIKDTPYYQIPEGLKAEAGTKLSEIALPAGFEWMNDTQVVTGEGDEIYYVRFVPEDTNNYEIIENIKVIVNETSNVMTNFELYGIKTEYRAFETVDTDTLYAKITYDDGHIEYVHDDISISYQQSGEDCFKYGDTLFHVRVLTKKEILIARSIYVTVLKAIPEYTVPTNIEAKVGQTLEEIILPEGFYWRDVTQVLTEIGNIKYLANYIANDTNNYDIVENIEININVLPKNTLPFTDIKETDWCYEAVEFVYNNGYILGFTNTTYGPGEKLTRGMIVTILNRMEGYNIVEGESKFDDVKSTEYYYDSVKWATTVGIVHGYEDGYFRPDNYITREELAVILRNYTIYKEIDTNLVADLSKFNDGNTVSSFAQSAVEWAVFSRVITGYTDDNTVRPQGTATRDVTASMIYKYFVNIIIGEE